MSAIFNMSSLLLGLLAWIIAAVNIGTRNKFNIKGRMWLTAISFSACAFSLCMQLVEVSHRVTIEDWSALMDTCGVIVFAAGAMAVITVALNVIAILTTPKNKL